MVTASAEPTAYPVPQVLRSAVLVISALIVLSALGAGTLALFTPALRAGMATPWPLVGFEGVALVAGVIGVLFGLGRYAQGPGLALACVGGTVLMATVLGYQGSGGSLLGYPLKGFLAARAGSCLAVLAIASHIVLRRNPCAWRRAVVGGLLLLPAAAVGVAAMTDGGRRLIGAALGQSPVQSVVVGTAGALGVGIMLAAGGHLVITAFEMCRSVSSPTTSRPGAP